MTDLDLAALCDLAVAVAHEAGELLLGYYDGASPSEALTASIRSKSTRTDLVTAADRASEELVIERLLAERPHDGILGEEGGARQGTSGLEWVIDPLDGTINFVYGFPAFGVSIACESSDGTLVGVVFDPLRRETWSAVVGQGAFLDHERVTVSADPPPLSEALIATGFSYDADRRSAQGGLLATVLPAVRDIRRAGAAALDLCWVASGRLDGCYEAGLAPWDLAAGALLVAEAGGALDLVGGLVPGAMTVVAGPPRLQQALCRLLEQARQAGEE